LDRQALKADRATPITRHIAAFGKWKSNGGLPGKYLAWRFAL
jgi:hypothetical protein